MPENMDVGMSKETSYEKMVSHQAELAMVLVLYIVLRPHYVIRTILSRSTSFGKKLSNVGRLLCSHTRTIFFSTNTREDSEQASNLIASMRSEQGNISQTS